MILGSHGLAVMESLIFSTAVIYPVVKVHRRGGSASRARLPVPQLSAGLWALARAHGSEGCCLCGSGHDSTAPGTACEPSGTSRPVDPEVDPGNDPGDVVLRTCGLQGGGDEETRTPDPLLAKEMLCQLSYVPPDPNVRGRVVGAPGLEPGTSALSGPRSNQLSYAP